MSQRFRASERREFSNGAVGYAPGGPFDCLGPYARVVNCPVKGHERRYTCYATGYADTYFSIPACTRIKGKYIKGFFSCDSDNAITFTPFSKEKDK
jgi:hypothetical protein